MLHKLRYQYNLYISFSFIVTLILFICGSFFFQYNSKLLRTNIEKNSIDALNLIQSRFEYMLNDINKILTRISVSKEFTNITFSIPENQTNYFIQNPTINSNIKSMFSSILSTESITSSLYYTSRYYDYVGIRITKSHYGERYLTKSQVKDFDYIQSGLKTDEYCFFNPPHQNPWTLDQELVFSVVRPIRDTYKIYGILEYNQNVKELDNLLTLTNNKDIYRFILLDSNNDFLYSNIPFDTKEELELLSKNIVLENQNGYFYLDKNTLTCYTKSELTGWTLLIQRDTHTATNQINDLAKMIFFSYAAGFIVLLIFLYLLTKELTRPLRILQNNLSVLELNQDIHIDTGSSNNEIVVLTTAIEDILNRLRLQNVRLIEARKRALKAHFDAMEAQLNPHFLYNTLAIIGSYGQETKNKTVAKMCSELANLLRYSVSYNYKTVSLKDELENITQYLYIMKMRYEHMLEYSWDLDHSIDFIRVPKLILQPIIENCFQHGFSDMPPTWYIQIKTYKKNNYWYASISNNGKPFEDGKKEELYSHFQKFKKSFLENTAQENPLEKQGLGLENTIMRLSIYYQGKEYFQIYAKDNLTTIEIGGIIDEI